MEFILLPSEIQITIFSFTSDFNWAFCDTQSFSIFNYLKEKALKNPEKVILDKSLFYQVLKPTSELMKIAIKIGFIEVVKRWLNVVGLINSDKAMYKAAREGHLDLVKFFIGKGAKALNLGMLKASKGGHLEVVEF